MPPTPTVDPYIFIEEQRPGYIRYWRSTDNRRWEVHGTCRHIGECMIGAVLDDGTYFDTLEEVLAWQPLHPGEDMYDKDCPVTPEFQSCCASPERKWLTYVELEPGPYQES